MPISNISFAKRPKRIILHWTAGRHIANRDELLGYHFLIEHYIRDMDDPNDDITRLISGVPVERNCRSLVGEPSAKTNSETGYAAHTSRFNSYSIGVALCGMANAVDYRPENPVNPGPSPITTLQVESLLFVCYQLCKILEFEPNENRLFTHWEAEHIHGKNQSGRWDITWIPGENFNREEVGPWIRHRVKFLFEKE